VCIYYATHTVKDDRIFKIAASPLFMRPIGMKIGISFEVYREPASPPVAGCVFGYSPQQRAASFRFRYAGGLGFD